MIGFETILSFGLYLLFLLAVGGYFYRKNDDLEAYLLAGRGLGSWVTALSAQASDMSGWLLMGLPGALYLGGMKASWIAIGLLVGTFFNWLLVAPRLRVYTEVTRSLTLSTFFGERFKDPHGLLRIGSSLITLFFFTIYASSGLVASGKLFESLFKMDYFTATAVGGTVIILYTFLGGFAAVCWTDFVQGSLMFAAIIIVPLMAIARGGDVTAALTAKGLSMSPLVDGAKTISLLGVVSTAAWGLGYFGQPHILARFMGIRSVKDLPKSTSIAMIWVAISLAGAVAVGILALPMYPELKVPDNEKVFIYMIRDLFHPYLAGVMLAAILSAIMSTIDSQLLVSSSTLTEDIYRRVIRRDASDKELLLVGRLCVLLVAAVAFVLAMDRESTVLGLVSYAWGGFGAAFGPVVVMALFSRQTSWQAALSGMLAGTAVLVGWQLLGWSASMYEIVPGCIANVLAILIVNVVIKRVDPVVDAEFDEMLAKVSSAGK